MQLLAIDYYILPKWIVRNLSKAPNNLIESTWVSGEYVLMGTVFIKKPKVGFETNRILPSRSQCFRITHFGFPIGTDYAISFCCKHRFSLKTVQWDVVMHCEFVLYSVDQRHLQPTRDSWCSISITLFGVEQLQGRISKAVVMSPPFEHTQREGEENNKSFSWKFCLYWYSYLIFEFIDQQKWQIPNPSLQVNQSITRQNERPLSVSSVEN